MNKQERIEEEIEKTLHCFEEFETLEPNPFFLTRLKAKIRNSEAEQARSGESGWNVWSLRPILLSILVVLNLFSAILVYRGHERQTAPDARAQYLAAFAQEYALTQEDDAFSSLLN